MRTAKRCLKHCKILLFILLPFATNLLELNDAVLTDHPFLKYNNTGALSHVMEQFSVII